MSRMNEREIARKLAEREELEPPAGLLEKIKSEIPPSIPVGTGTPEVETPSPAAPRQRWLMAASVAAMIGAGLLAFQLRTPMAPVEETAGSKALLQRTDRAPAAPSVPSAPPPARMSPPGQAEPLLDAGQAPPPPPPPPPPPKPLSRKETDELKSLGYVAPQGVAGGVEGGVVGGVPGGVAGGAVGGAPAPREAEPPVQEVEAPESVAAPAAAPAPQDMAKEERRANAAADSAMAAAESAKPAPEVRRKSVEANPFKDTATQPLSIFETDSGTASYELVRRSLLQGKLPDPGAIRVGEVLNGFEAGGLPPVEGAPTPFRDSRYRLLGFRLPAGHRVEVEFNPAVVVRYRLLGNGLYTLYEIELRPEAPRDGRVLTLRLGATEKAVALSTLASSWPSASPGFRLAALAAEFAEVLKGSSRADLAEVARQAHDARKGLPNSVRAAELVDLVEKAARIKGASPE